jgi:hypothetical protein
VRSWGTHALMSWHCAVVDITREKGRKGRRGSGLEKVDKDNTKTYLPTSPVVPVQDPDSTSG